MKRPMSSATEIPQPMPRPHQPRLTPLADQQIAGVTMAAEEAAVFFGAFTVYLLRFLRDEQAAGLAAAAPHRR